MQSLEDIPTLFSTAWGIDLVSAQLIISTFVILALILPIMVLRAGNKAPSFNIEIVMGFIGMALCVGLGWLHIWILIASVVLISIAAAFLGTEVVFGT